MFNVKTLNAEYINRESITDQNKNFYLNEDIEEWKLKSKEFLQLLRYKVVADQRSQRTISNKKEPSRYSKVKSILQSYNQEHRSEHKGWT